MGNITTTTGVGIVEFPCGVGQPGAQFVPKVQSLTCQVDQPGAGVDHKTVLSEGDKAAQVMTASYAGTARSAQQKAWVLRGQSAVAKAQAWRPKKVHRQAARKFLASVDNQIAGSTRFQGWVSFMPTKAALWKPSNWRNWPQVGSSIDGGSDCVCGTLALEYKWFLNLTKFMDHSHQKHRALDAALAVVDMKAFWLLNIISMNLPHGPWSDDARYNEVNDHMKHHWQQLHGDIDPVLDDLVDRVADELCQYGGFKMARAEKREKVIAFVRGRVTDGTRKGYQCNLNRFLGSFCESKKQLSLWSTHLHERTITGLDADMFKGGAFKKLVLHGHRAELADAEAVGATSSSIRASHDKALRNACQNSLVVSVMFLADLANRKMVASIVEVVEPHVTWHGTANRELRSCPKALEWLLGQAEGAYMDHLRLVKDRMENVGVLQRFICTSQCVSKSFVIFNVC